MKIINIIFIIFLSLQFNINASDTIKSGGYNYIYEDESWADYF
jgi:hypothetical protein